MPAFTKQVGPAVVEEQTLAMVREMLVELGSKHAVEKVTPGASFDRDLGLGSLERVELLVRSEARFGVQLPDDVAQEAETVGEWIDAILGSGGPVETKERYRIVPPARLAPPEPVAATTLVEALRAHAEVEPDRIHIHLPEDDRGQDITYRELLDRASAVAAGLVAAGLGREQTVAIMLPTCADFFYAFFGVMLAGGIAVPIYPPARPDKIEEYVRRQVLILRNAEIRFLITFDRVKAVSQLMRAQLPSLIEVTNVAALSRPGAPFKAVEPADLGFIQYTSGSTGDPKGVMLTHANILANVRGIGQAVKVRPDDVVVTWLPLYHDMGLIGSWLFALYHAAPITVLSPLAFLSRPERWLWAMHDAGGTLCPAPNFSYELCARKIPDRALEGLNLSSWRVAINAGEAVLPDTIARFSKRFAKYGFRAESMLPCYGLAESSVALAFPPIDRRPRIDTIRREAYEQYGRAEPATPGETNVMRFVSAGSPLPQHEARLVDEQGHEAGERRQGKLLFRGLSRTSGYYRNPAATAAAMTPDGWMDSGDLAYWADGELFITGRLKDCIIKSGRNIIPQEVEAAASEVPGVRRGCVAAFGVTDPATGTERIVVVAETRAVAAEELRRIEADVVRGVEAVIGIPPDKVALVRPQTVPKTSSGKIRRAETKALFVAGKLEGRQRAPWVQITSLWLENAGSWLGRAAQRARERAAETWIAALLSLASLAGGVALQVLPLRWGGRVLHWSARWFLFATGQEVEVAGLEKLEADRPAVLVANHPGRLDALILAAALPETFLLSDSGALASLRLLEPLVVEPLTGNQAPPGGTQKQRIQRGLAAGHSVVVFPEGPRGEPAWRCRFRLDGFHAALETGAPVHPVAIRRANVTVGEAIQPEPENRREVIRLREAVREALGRLAQQKADA